MSDLYRKIPAVGDAIHWPRVQEWLEDHPRALVVRALSDAAKSLRERIAEGKNVTVSQEAFLIEAHRKLKLLSQPKLRKVINATGIIVHTNLGRSVLARDAIDAVIDAAGSYSTLEYDLDQRKRGSRNALVNDLLCRITGAEAAIAVNNNAAAVFLALNTLAQDREVIVSRGELVEIGGSFRIPDVMAKSGCRLVEVGATNKTHERDYAGAVTTQTALLLKVHTSNYRIMGFTAQVSGADLVAIGRRFGIPVMEDLGSGYLFGPDLSIMRDEPTVADAVKAGLDVVTFSGDKLLGGPQAGIILGKEEIIHKIAKNPLARAVRLDKMTLAALEATLRLYENPETVLSKIPTLKMAGASLKVLREKARRIGVILKKKVGSRADVKVVTTTARIGGGALPLTDLPSAAVAILPRELSLDELDKMLHDLPTPIVGRIENDRYLLDVRTLLDGEAKIVQNEVGKVVTGETKK